MYLYFAELPAAVSLRCHAAETAACLIGILIAAGISSLIICRAEEERAWQDLRGNILFPTGFFIPLLLGA